MDGQIVYGMSLGSERAATRGEEEGTMIETEGGSKEVFVGTKVREALWLRFLRDRERKDRSIILRKM